jgi:hypothetical protein
MRKLLGIAGIAFALAVGGAQAATELLFTITGAGHVITFDLPQNPTPDTFSAGDFFAITQVFGTYDGDARAFDGAAFFNSVQNTGNLHFDFFSPYFGDQLYTGPESAPTFKIGTFDITDQEFDYVLTIGAVPEASTWALMLLGFAGLGFAGYRRAVKAAAAV